MDVIITLELGNILRFRVRNSLVLNIKNKNHKFDD